MKEYIYFRFVSSIPIELKGMITKSENFEICLNNENEIEVRIPVKFLLQKRIKRKTVASLRKGSRQRIAPGSRQIPSAVEGSNCALCEWETMWPHCPVGPGCKYTENKLKQEGLYGI